MEVAIFPGTFNPPTIAHIEIALAALEQLQLNRVDFALSRKALNKVDPDLTPLDLRLKAIATLVKSYPRLGLVYSDRQLIVDMSEGYEYVILGSDKYHQLHDQRYYESRKALLAGLARLPTLVIAPRGESAPPNTISLDLSSDLSTVSSTLARAGNRSLLPGPIRNLNIDWTYGEGLQDNTLEGI